MGVQRTIMGFELEGLDPVPRTFEDDELEGETELMHSQVAITTEVLVPDVSATSLFVATTKAAACFLRAFGGEAVPVGCIMLNEGTSSHVCKIWSSTDHPELVFAHSEGAVPADRSLEWANILLEMVKVQSVILMHSLTPMDCDRCGDLPVCAMLTDNFKDWAGNRLDGISPLPPPYTVIGEAAAIMTRCQLLHRAAAAFICWEHESEFGTELLARWEPCVQLVTGSCVPDLKQSYFDQIKEHCRADHYIYS